MTETVKAPTSLETADLEVMGVLIHRKEMGGSRQEATRGKRQVSNRGLQGGQMVHAPQVEVGVGPGQLKDRLRNKLKVSAHWGVESGRVAAH